MARAVKIDLKELKQFSKQLENLQKEIEEICISLTKEIAARLLSKVIRRTPVGVKPFGKGVKKTIKVKTSRGNRSYLTKEGAILEKYWSGYVGGNLRRNWTVKEVVKEGNNYTVEVINSSEYASYVEYGHRQRPGRFVPQIGKKLKKSWVQGHFMLTISTKEINEDLESIINRKLKAIFKEKLG